MTTEDILMNLLLGVVSGSISGAITGVIITKYYRKKDKNEQWWRQLSNDKQNMSQFITEISNELEFLSKNLDWDTKHIIRLLAKAPRFISFEQIEKIFKEHRNVTSEVYSLFDEIEIYLNTGVLSEYDLMLFRSRVVKARFDILTINTVAVECNIEI